MNYATRQWMQAAGMGDLSLPLPNQITPDPNWTGLPNIFGTPTISSGGGGGIDTSPDRFTQITNLISQGLQTVLAYKAVDSGLYSRINNNPYALQQYAQNPNAYYSQYGGGLGFGIDGSGLRLSDGSHISWLLIGGAVLAWKLLQSPGYERRR